MIKFEIGGDRFQNRVSSAEMQRRWDAAAALLKEKGLDCLITQANDAMLCQYARWLTEIRTDHYFYVLFDKNGDVSIIGHGGDNAPLVGLPLKLKYNCCYPVFHNNYDGYPLAGKKVAGFIKQDGYKKIGIVGKNLMTVAFYEALQAELGDAEFTDITNDFDYLVAVKSEEEFKWIDEAVDVHDTIVKAIPSILYAGRAEREYSADLYRLAIIRGGADYLNNLFVASQPIPGPMFGARYCNKVINEGDVLNTLVEVPTNTGYYCDLHRYWSIGEPSEDVVQAFKYADEARAYMASLCVPGAVACDIFVKMNEWRAERNLGQEKRMHGHGQGYGLVERPYFDAQDKMVLKEDMYVSLHPTVVYKGISVGPGENYRITKDGAVCVSNAGESLIVLK